MSFDSVSRIRRSVVELPRRTPPPPPAEAKPAAKPTGYSQADTFEAKPAAESSAPAGNTWSGDLPLSEARNAHRTNTKEEFQAALDSDANWFEGMSARRSTTTRRRCVTTRRTRTATTSPSMNG
ncbi:hypothetical protein SAMN05443572_11388 [Myxococcus fulvus]|uniref:Uncharacterized protein n=1 Tax=Myxococcus fulvus TaxID=33 RepID=A0A511TIB7_MYXFU|nr:hypothetical protein [Myxococcus fulvus]GEN12948.1 hypothetical protein MFU01_79850 [Myxococcus fulvus]SEU38497.1 hypothetical protein SAMN05443572_11388 [Myxococcus fulvus]